MINLILSTSQLDPFKFYHKFGSWCIFRTYSFKTIVRQITSTWLKGSIHGEIYSSAAVLSSIFDSQFYKSTYFRFNICIDIYRYFRYIKNLIFQVSQEQQSLFQFFFNSASKYFYFRLRRFQQHSNGESKVTPLSRYLDKNELVSVEEASFDGLTSLTEL